MLYRTMSVLMLLAWLAAGAVFPAKADGPNLPSFRGPSGVCLHSTLIYPCVSLSPPGYRSSLKPAMGAPLAQRAPDDNGRHGWPGYNIRLEDARRPSPQPDNLNQAPPQPDPAMKMGVVGPLKFKVFTEDGNLSESRFFLGIDRTW